MTACYVCGVEITEKQPTVAARIITPGPGLVQACSAKCATDPKFMRPDLFPPEAKPLVIPIGTYTGEAKEHADRGLAASFRKLTAAMESFRRRAK